MALTLLSSSVGASGATGSAGATAKLRVTDEEFRNLQEFIYEKAGIFINESRKYLIENRLINRIKELNLKNFGEYYYFLQFDRNKATELQRLFEVITTNETSFYRNPPQLKIFQDVIVPQELEKCKATKKLRIWSAGCSTGEEPYTLAIILNEVLGTQRAQWDIRITATDLSEAVVRAAQKGIYSEYALRTTPKEIVAKYFKKVDSVYHVDPALKRMIQFSNLNLNDRLAMKRVERSNILFCRNVIIYFDDEMKRNVMEAFYDNIVPNGCMLIGHSESLHNISRGFKPEHYTGTIVYRKEG